MKTTIKMICGLMATTLLLSGCPDDEPPQSNNSKAKDMSADQGDMSGDMAADMKDMAPPACTTADDCTGDFSDWECVGGVCANCERGDIDCVCRANGTCKDGARCGDNELCVACQPGLKDCPCDAGDVCGDGLKCESNVCVTDDCVEGTVDCPCDVTGGCGAELYCDDMTVCRACTSDVPGCACELDGTCQGDNYCDTDNNDTCVACPDDDKPEHCACDKDTDCDTGLACDADSGLCRPKASCDTLCVPNQTCDESGAGDPICVPMSCQMGYVWDNGACVMPAAGDSCDGRNGTTDKSTECANQGKTCVEYGMNQAACVDTCDSIDPLCDMANKECSEYSGATDATCGACKPGYMDDGGGNCVIDTAANCSTFGAVGSIAMTCAARNQACNELATGGAECGDCLSGFVEKPGALGCVDASRCGGEICLDTEYCSFPQTGGAPSCEPRACGAGEALDAATGTCTTCNLNCDAQGLYATTINGACACASDVFCRYQFDGAGDRCTTTQTVACGANEVKDINGNCISCQLSCGNATGEGSRVWPYTTVDGTCICETQEGYYLPFGGAATPRKCDEDEDGWINRTAYETYLTATNVNVGGATEDAAILANFRCERREVDRFTLQNEWGQQRHVSLCNGDLIDYAPGAANGCTAPEGLTRVTLFEADALDSDDDITLDNTNFPAYGNRKLKAAELNALTKGCVTQSNDFNQNNIEDIQEEHAITKNRIQGLSFTGNTADEQFFFHSMSYFLEVHTGQYVAPLNAADAGSYIIAERSRCDATRFPIGYINTGLDYWRSCSRSRNSNYDYTESHVGYDFAHWGCSAASGNCGVPTPPTDNAFGDNDGDRIDDHGLCDRTDPVPNEPWFGMTHHSQFQCVVLKSAVQAGENHQLEVADVYKDGEATPTAFTFNSCQAEDCSAGGANCEQSVSQGRYQPLVSNITCTTKQRDNVSSDEVGWVAVRYIPEGVNSSQARGPDYIRGCIDESHGTDGTDGWKTLCPGYNDNPDGVLAAANPGDFGKLICSCNRFFAGENCEISCLSRNGGSSATGGTSYVHVGDVDRNYSNEQVAEYACSPDDNYCSLHPPESSANFPGGRRGYWMCGDFSATRTLDANQQDTPYMEAQDSQMKLYQLRGGIKYLPVQRQLLTQSNCTNNCFSAF